MSGGWNFPVGINGKNGKILITDLKDDIKQSIYILLKTVPGERLLHPDYGCNLQKFLFEPITYELLKAIKNEVFSAISKWEKRIYNPQVSIKQDEKVHSKLIITITYIIPKIKEIDSTNFIYNVTGE